MPLPLTELPDVECPEWTENARRVFEMRFCRHDADGNLVETPDQAIDRVATNVAVVSALYAEGAWEPVQSQAEMDEAREAIDPDEFPWRTARRRYEQMLNDWSRGRDDGGPALPPPLELVLYRGMDDFLVQREKYLRLMLPMVLIPNSPTWTGAGTPLGQLAACFVLPVGDKLVDYDDGANGVASIMGTLHDAAAVQQTGGGNGFDFSRLRPRGALVERSMGQASGPVGFMEMYNGAFEVVHQGGARRGANMAILRVDHPDIREFIRCKTPAEALAQFGLDDLDDSLSPEVRKAIVESRLANFNISVAVTDEFMRAVADDGKFDLRFDGRVVETVRARDLYDEILRSTWTQGDPGNVFIDRMNADNPCPGRYTIEATNPCVTGDTWVMTAHGPRRAETLVGLPVPLVVDGKGYATTPEGFFPTGTKDVVRVTTSEGFTLSCTADHKIHHANFGWVQAGDLLAGEQIRLHDHVGARWGGVGDHHAGYLLGLLLGDGTFSEADRAVLSTWDADPGAGDVRVRVDEALTHLRVRADLAWRKIEDRGEWRLRSAAVTELARSYGMVKGNKHIHDHVEMASSDFYQGFLRALFDADGHVEGSADKGVSIRLAQSHRGDLEAAQRMLARLGILGRIYESRPEGDRPMPGGTYRTRQSWRLVIGGTHAGRFMADVGFSNSAKRAKYERLTEAMPRGHYSKPLVATVEAVEPVGSCPVFDVSVEEVHAFDANGIYVHNCGEQPLPPYGNCTLASLALPHFIGADGVHWSELAEAIAVATEFLDDVVDANQYVPAVPEIAEMATNERRIGLDFLGLADALFDLGYTYGSDAAASFTGSVAEFFRFHALRASSDRAKARGPFPWIVESLYDPSSSGERAWSDRLPIVWRHDRVSTQRPQWGDLDWPALSQAIANEGVRNATQLTFAPTGTRGVTALRTGVEGSGMEPAFALAYSRWVTQGDERIELHYLSPSLQRALDAHGLDEGQIEVILDRVRARDHEGVRKMLTEIGPFGHFVTAADVPPEGHIKMQAALQKWTDQAISKTVNFPFAATVEDMRAAYELAYTSGCKGITVYRQGSREVEVLSAAVAKVAETVMEKAGPAILAAMHSDALDERQFAESDWPSLDPIPLPSWVAQHGLPGRTFPVPTPFGTVQVTITEIYGHEGRPFDVRLSVGKAGSDKGADVEALGRLVSLALRCGVDVRHIVDQLANIGGRTIGGFGPNRVLSVPDAVARLLRQEYLGEGGRDELLTGAIASVVDPDPPAHEPIVSEEVAVDRTCPECGNASLVEASGCFHCEPRLGGCGNYTGCD